MDKLKQKLEKILKQEASFVDGETGFVNYAKVKDLADRFDGKLVALIAGDKELRAKFFQKVLDVFVFNVNDFKFFLDESKVFNSYTKYANRIGLVVNDNTVLDDNKVVLNFPFKDSVLQGGQSTDEGKDLYYEFDKKSGLYSEKSTEREEIFFNEILAHDEIDRLLDDKALVKWSRFSGDTPDGKKLSALNKNKDSKIDENLVIKGNNYIALNCLKSQYKNRVKLIYIDPPYNTVGDANTFVYNNTFNHSTWLTFMKNRLETAKELLRDDGFVAITIDHFELFYLGVLSDEIFGRQNRLGIVSVVIRPQGRQFSKFFSPTTEYMLVYAKDASKAKFNGVVLDDTKREEYTEREGADWFKYEPLMYSRFVEEKLTKGDKYYYPIYVSPDLHEITLEKKKGYTEVYPVNQKRKIAWRIQKDKFQELLQENTHKFCALEDKNGVQIFEKYYLSDGTKIKTHWIGKRYNATTSGTGVLKQIFGKKVFSYPKALYAVIDTLKIMTDGDDIILDFFAGSGTTAQAVIDLNAEDKGNRKFILVEQMDYIQSVIVPRVVKTLAKNNDKSDFVYCELAEWNESAKDLINDAKDLKELIKSFDSLYEKYYLNYNVSVRDFREKVVKEDEFQKLGLKEQKKMFLTMLDLNQMYVLSSEMADKKFAISKEDQGLTKDFYSK